MLTGSDSKPLRVGICMPSRPHQPTAVPRGRWGCLRDQVQGPLVAALKALPGVEVVEVDVRDAHLREGRVLVGEVDLSALDAYLWYAEVDRSPGSFEQVLLREPARTVRVHPDPWRWATAVDKLTAHCRLKAEGLPVPDFVAVHPHRMEPAMEALEAWGAGVLKPRLGAWGQGVVVLEHPGTLRDVVGFLQQVGAEPGGLLLERFLENDPQGWTSVTAVGGEPVVAYRKRAARWVDVGSGRRKVYDAEQSGGEVDPVPLDAVRSDLVRRAAKVLGCPIIGFDLLATEHGAVIVDENTSPGNDAALYRAAGLDPVEVFLQMWVECLSRG